MGAFMASVERVVQLNQVNQAENQWSNRQPEVDSLLAQQNFQEALVILTQVGEHTPPESDLSHSIACRRTLCQL